MDIKKDLLERFVVYAAMDSGVNLDNVGICRPTNPKEREISALLAKQLSELPGVEVYADDKAFVIGYLPGNKEGVESVAFMAHIDTSNGAPNAGVKPIVHENYDGNPIKLADGIVLDEPALLLHKGSTVVTSDGTTLLGADDKAGVSAIMSLMRYFALNPDIKHGPIEAVFTPDEEGGDGMSDFPLNKLRGKIAYTIDGGGEEGEVEFECYNAYGVDIAFKGVAMHPGSARGVMVNALSMMSAFINMIPRNESPEATDGYYGCYWPESASGSTESAKLHVAVRDHDKVIVERRISALKSFALAVEGAFPGGEVSLTVKESYLNMREAIEAEPAVMDRLYMAMKRAGVEPRVKPIRGGTDGSRLTAMGVPCPNIFTGGHNYHSRREWLALDVLEKVVLVAIEIAKG